MKEIDAEMNDTVAVDFEGLHLRWLSMIDLVGSPGLQGRVRSMTIVPIGEEEKLVSKPAPVERHEESSSALILQRENEALYNGNAADLAESTEAMLDSFSFAPRLETSADKLGTLVRDDTVRHSVDPRHRSSQECANRNGSGRKQEDAGALHPTGEAFHADNNPPTERPASRSCEGCP